MFETLVLPILLGVATVAGAGMIVPQVVRLHRTGLTDGVSPVWVGVGIAMNLWWLAYATALELWGLVPVSVGGITLYATLAVQLRRIEGRSAETAVARGHLIGLLPLAGLLVGGWPGAGLVIGLLYGAVFAPAVLDALRAASVAGVSTATWLLAWIEAAVWVVYGLAEADLTLVFGGTGGTLMATIILVRLLSARATPTIDGATLTPA